MSYKQRSQEYNWFKGQDNEGKKNKQNLKVIWKFSKIFLMFSLFFFSMWGCVQVWVIKTDNAIGKGVEVYQSESNISPRITRFNATKGSGNIYKLELKSTNDWIADKKGDNIKEVQKVITEGTGKDGSNIKMSDAFLGSNEAFALTIDNKQVKDLVSKDGDDKYLVYSTKAYKTTFTPASGLSVYIPKVTLTKNGFTFNDSKAKTMTFTPRANQTPTTAGSEIQAAYSYRYAVLKRFDDIMKSNPKTKHLALSANKANGNFNTSGVYDKNKEFAHNESVLRMLSYYNAESQGDTEEARRISTKLSFSDKYHKNDTTYRPIVTWGQAWVRGVGPFYGLFVFPISKIATGILNSFPMMAGWEALISIVLIVFLLRMFGFALTFKSVLQQTKQQELQAKKAKIDAKYLSYKGNKQMEARQRQEVSELYKKEGISPLGALGSVFVTMPIFLSMWRIIGGIQHFKATTWLGMQFSATSYKQLFAGEWQYLPLMILAGFSGAFSQLFPRMLTKKRDGHRINVQQKEAMKKNNKTQNIMLVVFVIMALIFTAGIQIYWIVGGVWQVIQTLISHHVIVYQKKKNKNRVKV